MQPSPGEPAASVIAEKTAHRKEAGEDLAGHRGRRHPHDAQVKDRHQQQVQQHVHHTGDGHVQQGAFRVSYGTEHGAEEIVHRQKRNAQEVDPQVDGGQGKDLRRGVHEPQHGAGYGDPQEGEEQTAHRARKGCGLHGLPHAQVVSGAEVPGGQNAGPGAQPHEQVDEQLHQSPVGADRRQGRVPVEPAHHDQVGGVEGQLQYAGEHHRHGKGNKLGQEPAFAEVDLMGAFHGKTSNRMVFERWDKA